MGYKWAVETSNKSVTYADGSTHTLVTERHWIDVIKLDHFKVTVEINFMQRDNEKPEASCSLFSNDERVQEWFTPTMEEATAIGETLIKQIKDGVNSIT